MNKIDRIKTMYTDFKGLKWYEYLFLIIAFIFITISGLIDLPSLFSGKGFIGAWDNPNHRPNWATWKAVLAGLAGVAGFTGVFCVFMVGKGKLSNYLWGALNTSLYGVFAFSVGYTGDAILNIFYFFPIQFIGFFTWKKHISKKTVIARKFKYKDFILFSIITIMLFGGFWLLIPAMDNELNKFVLGESSHEYDFRYKYLPRTFDTLTNTFSVVAQLLMVRRYKEQWYLWIVINILQVSMYSGINGWGINIPMILMWGIFSINAVYSLVNWIKLERKNKNE